MNQDKFFIGGDWVDPAGSDQLAVISPHTEEVIAKVPEATTADVDRAVAAAREAFDNGPWPQMSPAERADVIAAVSAGIPLNLVQKWLGHAQLTTTAIYADATGAEEKDIARRMWG